jgi:hypothetical protein
LNRFAFFDIVLHIFNFISNYVNDKILYTFKSYDGTKLRSGADFAKLFNYIEKHEQYFAKICNKSNINSHNNNNINDNNDEKDL